MEREHHRRGIRHASRVVPGIQGRWEWMKPAVDALAARCRVITFSLADEPTCGARSTTARASTATLGSRRRAGRARPGVSDRVWRLVRRPDRGRVCGAASGAHARSWSSSRLLPPSWKPDARVRFLHAGADAALAALLRELAQAVSRDACCKGERSLCDLRLPRHLATVVMNRFSPRRWRDACGYSRTTVWRANWLRSSVPTLVVTGEAELDRVVPVALTRDTCACGPMLDSHRSCEPDISG